MGNKILDDACGSKMFWFDKNNPNVTYCDIRKVDRTEYYPGMHLEINPDVICNFTDLPFPDGSFKLVVFDPPHLVNVGDTSWLKLKYGKLEGDWKSVIKQGFKECFRVLEVNGILIFKWSEVQIPLKEILSLCPQEPLFGNKSGKHMTTHWLCFMKL